jgi:hypothetical protein
MKCEHHVFKKSKNDSFVRSLISLGSVLGLGLNELGLCMSVSVSVLGLGLNELGLGLKK